MHTDVLLNKHALIGVFDKVSPQDRATNAQTTVRRFAAYHGVAF